MKNLNSFKAIARAIAYEARRQAELLEEGEVTEDVAALVILLEQGKCLKPYFSAFEQKEMRDKLQAISQTPAGKAVRDMVEYVENLIAVMTLLVTVFT